MEWVNCRVDRWQATSPQLSIDFGRNMDVGLNEYRYVLNVQLLDESSGMASPDDRYHNLFGWEFDTDIEVTDAGILGSGLVYQRDMPENERADNLTPLAFDIRCRPEAWLIRHPRCRTAPA